MGDRAPLTSPTTALGSEEAPAEPCREPLRAAVPSSLTAEETEAGVAHTSKPVAQAVWWQPGHVKATFQMSQSSLPQCVAFP